MGRYSYQVVDVLCYTQNINQVGEKGLCPYFYVLGTRQTHEWQINEWQTRVVSLVLKEIKRGFTRIFAWVDFFHGRIFALANLTQIYADFCMGGFLHERTFARANPRNP
ncbi:MAG: hypothetical protein FWG87_11990 [Defluviitaleaceae bacterium]|nr:hypothetical protein [Defluviitaleaceae bacterium]